MGVKKTGSEEEEDKGETRKHDSTDHMGPAWLRTPVHAMCRVLFAVQNTRTHRHQVCQITATAQLLHNIDVACVLQKGVPSTHTHTHTYMRDRSAHTSHAAIPTCLPACL